MTEQHPPAGPGPDPFAAPPNGPDGTAQPVSGQPWSTHSGDSIQGPRPPSYRAGKAQVPSAQPDREYPKTSVQPERDYPKTSEFPPVDPAMLYEPADYAEYSPPPPAPPGYRKPPPPPPAPRRKSNGPLIVVVIAVALLLCGGIATAGLLIGRGVRDAAKGAVGTTPATQAPTTAEPTQKPTPTGDDDDGKIGHDITVTYEVTGDGSAEVVYLEKRNGKPKHVHVDLPWKVTVQLRTPVVLSVTAVRASLSDGTVTCRTKIDGEVVKESSSDNGHFGTVSCVHVTLD